MTTVPVELHRDQAKQKLPAIPEPWTLRDTVWFTAIGLTLFIVLFAFMFSLADM